MFEEPRKYSRMSKKLVSTLFSRRNWTKQLQPHFSLKTRAAQNPWNQLIYINVSNVPPESHYVFRSQTTTMLWIHEKYKVTSKPYREFRNPAKRNQKHLALVVDGNMAPPIQTSASETTPFQSIIPCAPHHKELTMQVILPHQQGFREILLLSRLQK